jgi:hypothetical protein
MAIDKVVPGLPEVVPSGKALEQSTHNELLVDAARLGLLRIRELVSRSMDEAAERAKVRPSREQRLIFNASATVAKLLANVQMEAMRRKQDEAQLSACMAAVDAFEAQLCGPTKKDRRAAAGESCRAGREGTGEVIGAAIDAFERKLYGKQRPTERARGVGG